jgi:hypothetical protein
VEHHHLPNTTSDDLVVAAEHRQQMQIAQRATCESPELQMDGGLRIREQDSVAGHAHQLLSPDNIALLNARTSSRHYPS